MAHCEEVIICENTRGRGVPYDPFRKILQFWTKSGELLGEIDEWGPEYDPCTGDWLIPEHIKIRNVK